MQLTKLALALTVCAAVLFVILRSKYRTRLLYRMSRIYFDPMERMVVEVIGALNRNQDLDGNHYSIPWVMMLEVSDKEVQHTQGDRTNLFLAEEDGEVLCSAQILADAVMLRVDNRLCASAEEVYKKHWRNLLVALVRHRPGLSINAIVLVWAYDRLSEE